MWQHRQEERALKRTEIDVVKQRRNLEDTMRKLNAGIYIHVHDCTQNEVFHNHPITEGFDELLSCKSLQINSIFFHQCLTLHMCV